MASYSPKSPHFWKCKQHKRKWQIHGTRLQDNRVCVLQVRLWRGGFSWRVTVKILAIGEDHPDEMHGTGRRESHAARDQVRRRWRNGYWLTTKRVPIQSRKSNRSTTRGFRKPDPGIQGFWKPKDKHVLAQQRRIRKVREEHRGRPRKDKPSWPKSDQFK